MENLQNEVWKSVLGYEGYYEVSSIGRIRSLLRYVEQLGSNGELRTIPYKGKILSQKITTRGYYAQSIYISGNQKSCLIHRLVAQAFIPNPENKPQVNHINGIKTDNRIENLEWCTQSENHKEAFRLGLMTQKGERNASAKLTEVQVLEIRSKSGTKPYKEIGMEYKISGCSVSLIIARKTWTHI